MFSLKYESLLQESAKVKDTTSANSSCIKENPLKIMC